MENKCQACGRVIDVTREIITLSYRVGSNDGIEVPKKLPFHEECFRGASPEISWVMGSGTSHQSIFTVYLSSERSAPEELDK